MYVIIVYDVEADRTVKIHKECGQYLKWKQNSLFEGELTKPQFEELSGWIEDYIKEKEKVVIYRLHTEDAMNKEVFGTEEDDSGII
jgi:CRISPR-associated protein Cas2